MVAPAVKMYVWRSGVAANYSNGHVIVLARDLDEARDRARDALVQWSQRGGGYSSFIWEAIADADDLRAQVQVMNDITKDLAEEPSICDSLVVPGSE